MAAILPKNDPLADGSQCRVLPPEDSGDWGIIFTHFYFTLSGLVYVLGERCDVAFVDTVQSFDGKMSEIVELNCRTMKTETLSEIPFIDF